MLASASLAQDIGLVQSSIVVLDTDRLFIASKLGQQILEGYEQERTDLIARNEQVDKELAAEEQALTEKRAEMSPKDFRAAADAFDEKAQRIRGESEAAARDLVARRERAPVSFLRLVEPVLAQVMQDTGAEVMLNARTVLLRADAIDITDLAIERIDTVYEAQTTAPDTVADPDQGTPQD